MKVRLDWLQDPLFHLAMIGVAVAGLSAWRSSWSDDADPISYARVVYTAQPRVVDSPDQPGAEEVSAADVHPDREVLSN